jgi:hypothetical protein
MAMCRELQHNVPQRRDLSRPSQDVPGLPKGADDSRRTSRHEGGSPLDAAEVIAFMLRFQRDQE